MGLHTQENSAQADLEYVRYMLCESRFEALVAAARAYQEVGACSLDTTLLAVRENLES